MNFAARPSKYLMRAWRWHFYAGIFCLPFLTLLALTGIVVLFEKDIDDILFKSAAFVTVPLGMGEGAEKLPLERQAASARAEYPNWTLSKVKPEPAADRATAFTFADTKKQERTVFVDPYTARVQGVREEAWTPGNVATRLHGELLVGPVGDFFIELAASWALVLVASGLYLWWPRKVLAPAKVTPLARAFWSDLHASTGVWMSLVLVFFLLTGLTWSGVWGDKVAKVWTRFPAQLWDDVPSSGKGMGELAASLNAVDDKIVPWAVEASTLPVSKGDGRDASGHGEHAKHGGAGQADAREANQDVDLDTLFTLATSTGLSEGLTLALPSKPDGVFTLAAMPPDPRGERTLHVDRHSGKVLADIAWADYGVAAKAVEGGIALHEGRFFGFWNKMLALAGCLLVILSCVSAAVLWWRRRPSLRNARAPSAVVLPHAWTGALVLVAVLGLVFPLVGASLVAVTLVDALVVRRVPALRRAFGG